MKYHLFIAGMIKRAIEQGEDQLPEIVWAALFNDWSNPKVEGHEIDLRVFTQFGRVYRIIAIDGKVRWMRYLTRLNETEEEFEARH